VWVFVASSRAQHTSVFLIFARRVAVIEQPSVGNQMIGFVNVVLEQVEILG
jgi:hypothetical protein